MRGGGKGLSRPGQQAEAQVSESEGSRQWRRRGLAEGCVRIAGWGEGWPTANPSEALLGKYVQSAESLCEKQRQADSKGKEETKGIAYKLKVCGTGQDKPGMGKAGLAKAT